MHKISIYILTNVRNVCLTSLYKCNIGFLKVRISGRIMLYGVINIQNSLIFYMKDVIIKNIGITEKLSEVHSEKQKH